MKNKKTLIVLLIVLVLLILGSGGYIIYTYYSKSPTNQAINLKAYTNTQYGFEFNYPLGAKIETGPANGTSATLEINFITGQETLANNHVSVRVYANKDLIQLMPEGEQSGVVNFKNKNSDVLVQLSHDKRGDENIFNSVKSTFKFTTPVNQTASWKEYSDQFHLFSFNYPPSLKIDRQGPNEAEISLQTGDKVLDNGEKISGTMTPSYETIYLRDSKNKAKFQIDVFHATDKELTADNYKNYFYTSGLCDLRYLENQPSAKIIQKNGVSFIQVDAVGADNLPRTCFYTKNTVGNLIVVSMLAPESQSDYQTTKKIVESVLSTFQIKIPNNLGNEQQVKNQAIVADQAIERVLIVEWVGLSTPVQGAKFIPTADRLFTYIFRDGISKTGSWSIIHNLKTEGVVLPKTTSGVPVFSESDLKAFGDNYLKIKYNDAAFGTDYYGMTFLNNDTTLELTNMVTGDKMAYTNNVY